MSKEPDRVTISLFANYQWEIYYGPPGEGPSIPFGFAELEERARSQLSPGAFGYIAGGAGAEETMRANREAFSSWRIVPRMLRDVARRDLRTTVLGTDMPARLMLAPVGALSIALPDVYLVWAW